MTAPLRCRALLAGTALAALALTGCAASGDDDAADASQETPAAASETTAEPSQEASSGAESSEEASSDPSASDGASAQAPEDLEDTDLASALSSEIGGAQLMALTPEQVSSGSSEVDVEFSSEMGGDFEVEPSECQDPVLAGLFPGMEDTEDSVIAIDEEGTLLVTARTYDDGQAAAQALEDRREGIDGCEEVTVVAEEGDQSIALRTEDLSVEGAAGAFESIAATDGETVANAAMAYGNTVVTVLETGQFDGGPAPENQELLDDIVRAIAQD